MEQLHEFSYCYATEVTHYVYVPEHDDFIDGLPINVEAIETPLEADDEA
jgi:hypothetical protein